MMDFSIPSPLRDIVERELERGERIEWMETPKRAFFTAGSTGAFLFGIPWTAFALFWTGAAAWMSNAADVEGDAGPFRFFPLFGLPFILVGFGMLSSPLWAYRRSRNTVYVITDRRAIIFAGGSKTTIRSFLPSQLKTVFRREKKDGSGDVLFGRRTYRDSDGDRHHEEIGFFRIADAKRVEDRLQELAQRQASPKA
jgi:hypothetical protein